MWNPESPSIEEYKKINNLNKGEKILKSLEINKNSSRYDITRIWKGLDKISISDDDISKISDFLETLKNDDDKIKFLSDLRQISRLDGNNQVDFAIYCYKNGKKISDLILDTTELESDKFTIETIYKYIDEWKELSAIDLWENGIKSLDEILNDFLREKWEQEKKALLNNIFQRYTENIKNLIDKSLNKGLTPNELVKQLNNEENKDLLTTYSQYKNLWIKYWSVFRASKKWNRFGNLTIEESFKIQLKVLNYQIDDVNEEVLKEEEELIEERQKSNIKVFERSRKKRDLERNKPKPSEWIETWLWWPAWRKIASNMGMWQQLIDKYKSDSYEVDINDPRVFDYARWKFCKDNKGFWLWRLSPKLVKDLYEETNNFTNFNRKWQALKTLKERIPWFEKSRLSIKFFDFYNYLNDAQEKVSSFISHMNEKRDTTINNIAIGSVLDGFRKIFSDLWKNNNGEISNLQLDNGKPIELQNNSAWLIINWTFKWNHVKIKYNLITWEVYMNTCIAGTIPWRMLIFWNTSPNLYIWKISDFSSILENYEDNFNSSKSWKLEDINAEREAVKAKMEESFNKWIENIKNVINDSLTTNQIKNDAATKLLKTLGIVDNNTTWTIQFEPWSDAYNVMQIINNSDLKNINAFSNYMPSITKYTWKIWGNNVQDPTMDEYKAILSLKNKNLDNSKECNDIKYFLNIITGADAQDKYENNGWPKWQIDKNYKNWFASFICEKFTNPSEPPNRKLEQSKIEEFLKSLEKCNDIRLGLEL